MSEPGRRAFAQKLNKYGLKVILFGSVLRYSHVFKYNIRKIHSDATKDAIFLDTGYPHDGRADNAAYRHDRRADKRRYPHDREIDIQMLKMFRNGYILS